MTDDREQCDNYGNGYGWRLVCLCLLFAVVFGVAAVTPAMATDSNVAPTSSVDSPAQELTITVGESVSFTTAAEDADSNLHGVSWYLDGSHQGISYAVSGASGTDTWTYTFEESGTYIVEGTVFDEDWAYNSDPATWTHRRGSKQPTDDSADHTDPDDHCRAKRVGRLWGDGQRQ